MHRWNLWLPAMFALLAACDRPVTEPPLDDGPPAEQTGVLREWQFLAVDRITDHESDWFEQESGVVSDRREYGGARSEIYSNATGHTYWVSTQAPSVLTDPNDYLGTAVALRHAYGFRKTSPDATIRFEITGLTLDALDGDPSAARFGSCLPGDGPGAPCEHDMRAFVELSLDFYATTTDVDAERCLDGQDGQIWTCMGSASGEISMYGRHGAWSYDAYTDDFSDIDFWIDDIFQFDPAVGGYRGEAQLRLRDRVFVDVPLDEVDVGAEIEIHTSVIAGAVNLRQGESHMSAFFRDPLSADGVRLSYTGVVPVKPTRRRERTRPAKGPVCTPGVTPTGTVQFAWPAFSAPETFQHGRVVVKRTGGSTGAVSALLTTGGGTATPGVDYTPLSTYVSFADGEEGDRLVKIELLNDAAEEPDETIGLTLSVGEGCATIGSPAQATLTILDDDTPPPTAATYTVGGTLAGLVGSGLELTLNALTDRVTPAGNGPFVFGQAFVDGWPYNVVIARQPSDPDQACIVANGTGRIDGANVTNIEVTCAPPSTHGGLDPGFGSAGKVTAGLPEGARRIALQNDGRIVAVGGRTLARYLPSGALDPSFGSGGQVSIRLNQNSDEVRSVAIQPDGRIVVAGYGRTGVNSPTDFDIGVARFHADGTADTTFGDQGLVIIDFHGESDTAEEVLIQPDGRIVVAGSARDRPGGILNADYAVLRLTATGELDTGFGQGGKVMTNIAGQTDLPAAALLQPDGRIVLGGRVGSSGGASPDMALVRYNPDGTLDTGFGAGGIARLQTPGVWDEVQGLALQPDGKLIAVGNENIQSQGSPTTFKVVRFNADGSLDTTFGTVGAVTVIPFSTRDDFGQAVAVQVDGRIVVAGLASRLQDPDMAIARLNVDGTIDTSFGTDGMMTVDFFGGHDQANAVLIQPDGAIVAAGSAVNGTTTGLGMVRVLP